MHQISRFLNTDAFFSFMFSHWKVTINFSSKRLLLDDILRFQSRQLHAPCQLKWSELPTHAENHILSWLIKMVQFQRNRIVEFVSTDVSLSAPESKYSGMGNEPWGWKIFPFMEPTKGPRVSMTSHPQQCTNKFNQFIHPLNNISERLGVPISWIYWFTDSESV